MLTTVQTLPPAPQRTAGTGAAFLGRAGGSSGGGGVAEVTQVVATESVDRGLHDNFFNLYSAGNVRHAILLNCGASQAQYTVTFVTGTAGPIWNFAVDGNTTFYFNWGDGLGEGVDMAYVFDGNPIPADQIALSFANLINTGVAGQAIATANGASVTITAGGNIGGASTLQINYNTVAQGQDAATSIPGVDTIFVNIGAADIPAEDVAEALIDAIEGSGLWFAVKDNEFVTITDRATGARTDAWDGNENEEHRTLFAITILTQGEDAP
jgi:hypothetical protein